MSSEYRIYADAKGQQYMSVTSLVSEMFPFDTGKWLAYCKYKGLDPAEVTRQSVRLGTRYHNYFENRGQFERKEIEYFGKMVMATQYDFVEDEGDLGYLECANQFIDQGWEIIESEIQVVNKDLLYAGRVDMVVRNDKLGVDRAIADVKTWGAWSGKGTGKIRKPEKMKKLAIQLSMYRRALGERLPMYGVFPNPDGQLYIDEIQEDESWIEEAGRARESILGKIERGEVKMTIETLLEHET